MEYRTAANESAAARFVCKGLMGLADVSPSFVDDTSAGSVLSALWVGDAGALRVSVATWFDEEDMYFFNAVTIENTGALPCGCGGWLAPASCAMPPLCECFFWVCRHTRGCRCRRSHCAPRNATVTSHT